MINELEIVLFENLSKRDQMKKLLFTKLSIIATELPFLTSVGFGIYKAITLFNTKYKNEHQILVLEGTDEKKRQIFAITELVSATSGFDVSGEESGYYLFLTPNLEEFYDNRELKNPLIRETRDIHLNGDQLFDLVLEEKKEYKLIGNNCQDYTKRMTKYIQSLSKENILIRYDNKLTRKKNKSKSIQISNLKKKVKSNSMIYNELLLNYNLQDESSNLISDTKSNKVKSFEIDKTSNKRLILPKIEKNFNTSVRNSINIDDKISNISRQSMILENTQNESSINNILPSESLIKSSNSFFKVKVPTSNNLRGRNPLQMIKEVQNEAQISFLHF